MTTGTVFPILIFLETSDDPWIKIELASMPFSDVDVILLLKITGPSNLEITSLFGPPSTWMDLVTLISMGLEISNLSTVSSPVTVGIGAS